MKNSLFIGVSTLLCFSASFVSALPLDSTGISRRVQSKTDSGLTVSDVESDWPDNATLERVLKSTPGKAFFWTGRNGGVSVEGKALLVAKSQRGNTLEGTLAAANLIMPAFNFSNPKTVEIWTFASQSFSKQATGETFLVTGRSIREGNVFHTEELPRLKANRAITKITKIDSNTNRKTVIFQRNANKLDAAANEANARQKACLAKPPILTIPRRSNSFRRDLTEPPPPAKRAAPPARSSRRQLAAAPACPLPGAAQTKKVVQRSNTSSKQPPDRSFQAGGKKPAAKPPAAKRKIPRPANRPRRPPGKAAPPRKRITPAKKPKKVPKPAKKARGTARKRR